jgi:dTMP kinase
MKGLFITLEGVEGCGKTTQIVRLAEYLRGRGHEVVCTREPGGTPVAERIRALLLDPAHKEMSATAELLLYEAARAQHVDELIRPALEAGKSVICDRFADSTTAYQGAGRQLSAEAVAPLHRIATGEVWPDLTIVLDLCAEEGLRRAARARESDRLEQEPLEFHERVRAEFLRIALMEPERVKVIDASKAPDAVAEEIRAQVERLLSGRPNETRP